MSVTNYYSVGGVLLGETAPGLSHVDYLSDALGSVTATWGYYSKITSLAHAGTWTWRQRGDNSGACAQLAAMVPDGFTKDGVKFTW